MLNILITGGSGLLALNLASYFRQSHQVTLGLHHNRVTLSQVKTLPLPASQNALCSVIREHEFNLVIHAAGMTDVDACEKNPEEAQKVNAHLSRDVAAACRAAGVKLVHISTDHLFNGLEPKRDELAPASPLNEYARSKLLAEQLVTEACPGALVIRTNFFGWGHPKRRSFSDWIINSMRQQKPINLFKDVYFSPILISVLAEQLARLLQINASGIFNVVSDERLSKSDFGLKLCSAFGFNPALIREVSVESVDLSAIRPKDMSLDNTKLKRATSSTIPSLDAQLMMLKGQLDSGWADEIRNSLMES
jgi:dTDP-4-dehydrorhamnose reductase